MAKKDDMKKRMKEQFDNIEKLNVDTSYESKVRQIERRKLSDLKELEDNYIIPELRKDDFDRLYESIKRDGLKKPIDISKENIVLDGNHRLRIAGELGLEEVDVIVKDVPREHYIIYAIEDALNRRQLNDAQRADMILRLKSFYQNERIDRREQNLRKGAKFPEGVRSNTLGKTIDVLSKKSGVSPSYLKQYEKVKKESPELAGDVRHGKVSVYKAYNQVKKPKPSSPPVEINAFLTDTGRKGIIDWKSDQHKKEIYIFFEDNETREVVTKGIKTIIKQNKIEITRRRK